MTDGCDPLTSRRSIGAEVSAHPRRVLWVIKGLGPGGAEQLLVNHARVRDRDRFRYEAVYLVPWKDQLVPVLRDLDVPVTCLPAPANRDLRWVWRLRRLLRDRQVDVVHCHSPLVASQVRLTVQTLPPGRRPALVYTEHNQWARHDRGTRLANRVTLPLERRVVAVSDGVRRSMDTRRPVEVLHHGIDVAAVRGLGAHRATIRAELGIAADEVVVGIVANLRREKAYETLLEAARRVTARMPEVRFVSIGQGPLQAELDELHRQLGLGDRFRFLGYQPDGVRLMTAFDIFTLSSRFEGLPVALMEAMALGLPVVATAVGGIPEATGHGACGPLVTAGSVEALAAALESVASDEVARHRFGAESLRRAEQFDAVRAVRRLEEIYLDATVGRASKSHR